MVSLQGHLDRNSRVVMTSRPKLGEKSFGHMGLSMAVHREKESAICLANISRDPAAFQLCSMEPLLPGNGGLAKGTCLC